MNESLMYGSEDEYNAVTLMLSLTTQACGHDDHCFKIGDSLNVSRVEEAGNLSREAGNHPLYCDSN